jgi:hypothetical protein
LSILILLHCFAESQDDTHRFKSAARNGVA